MVRNRPGPLMSVGMIPVIAAMGPCFFDCEIPRARIISD